MDPRDVQVFLDKKIDVMQIGARNAQNFPLLKEGGKTQTPILLKRGMSGTIDELLMAAEYIMSEGNDNVILCERGIRTFEKYTRNTLDLSAVPIIHEKTHLPIIVDPSHATGKANLVEPMMIAAVAAGADGTVCGAAFAAMLGLMMLETQLGWFPLAVFPAALAGALMAFLLWDFPPAKLHPGRCGCLYAAGAIGCIPLCIGYAELSIPLALPFWVEGGMVVLQVLFCRWKGRPLFAAAPLHRWLEMRGMSAVNSFYSLCALSVCGRALAVGLALSA